MFCVNCGNQMPDGSVFCDQCGISFNGMAVQGMQYQDQAQSLNVVDTVTSKINKMAGGHGAVKLRFRDFFDAVFTRHTHEEAEDIFICGTAKTTPPIGEVSADWPHPWLYSRVFLVLLLSTLGCFFIFDLFENEKAIPGLIFVGCMVVPISVLVFFFETNAPRDISIVEVVKIFFVGGVASILLVHPLLVIFPGSGVGDFVPAMLTGFIEELAKLLITAFFLSRMPQRNYILGGLLIGGAVGAGFAVFESAGYAFDRLLETYYLSDMTDNIIVRGILAIGGHVAWAAVEGAAMALCEKNGKFEINVLTDPRFLFFTGAMILLHGVWDTTVPYLEYVNWGFLGTPKHVLLIIIVWVFICVLLNRGLEQVNDLAAMSVEEPSRRRAAARRRERANAGVTSNAVGSMNEYAGQTTSSVPLQHEASTSRAHHVSAAHSATSHASTSRRRAAESIPVPVASAGPIQPIEQRSERVLVRETGQTFDASGRAAASATAFCVNCGSRLEAGARFCTECGTLL